MEQILDKIKDRVAEKASPIRTVKGVAEAIGMSEAGFYVMLKRGTAKYGTMLAIADALDVAVSYFNEDLNKDSNTKNNIKVSDKGINGFQELKDIFEEQLRAKDVQIAGLQRTVDVLLGKSEGVNELPLCSGDPIFDGLMAEYKSRVVNQMITTPTRKKLLNTETKSMARRSSSVRTR